MTAPRQPLRIVYGQAMTMFGLVLIGTAVALALVGALRHQRAQSVAEAQLRLELADGRAAVSQLDQHGDPLAPGTPLAQLYIPSIDLREIILEGTSGDVLTGGPGHRRDTVLPGQSGISVVMGRRAGYGGPFGRLPDLRVDDEIVVTTGQGEQKFAVTGIRHVGDPQPELPAAGLTLITADGLPFFPEDVVRVDAKLVTPVMPTPARAFDRTHLPASEQAMGVGQDATMPLVLWLQLLIVCGCGVVWIRHRLGLWHAWLVGLPTLGAVGLAAADTALRLLPNLL